MFVQSLILFFISYPSIAETVNNNDYHQRRHTSASSTLEFTANVDYNKVYQRSLNINNARIISIEPQDKLWFAIENGTIFALPLYGDYSGPFLIQFQQFNNNTHSDINNLIELKLNFNFTPSSSLFYPSNHLLLALFNISSTNYNNSLLNRYFIIRTLSLALNLSESLITIHKINGSMIKVYFSCDLYFSTNITYQLKTLIDRYYSRRLELLPLFSLPLIEISIIRFYKLTTTTTTTTTIIITTTTTTTTTTPLSLPLSTTTMISPIIEIKKGEITIRPRLLDDNSIKYNRTVTSFNNLILLKQFYQPLVIVPLSIIAIGLFICAIIACCLCCNRRSSSSSTLLLPSGPSGSPNNKHLYQHYSYRKHRQQHEFYKKKYRYHDQKQFISKGIPVVFAEELEEKIEQTHTPLVMRIEKAPYNDKQEQNELEKPSF
ncbi:unnamed protein product [Rotaria sp. Silwood1]|nr:unnamed protein product [Rotaria sp. Silwood1]CAF3411543.1 unnamed protein product [Rotaria sp. Silwood1]CAF3438095.1 unnamed protein product [Rotaria sp. Silwood1]CAF4573372.1 unnamed protein product [Rotaria sp. Silwood1]CAF4639430.1 unnamed protein product [Rotaria sp. Silwood1]